MAFAWPQGVKARRAWPRLLRDFRWRSDAAVQIQCHVRGYLTRVRLGKIHSIKSSLLWRKPLFSTLRAQAAHIIQKYFRFVASIFIFRPLAPYQIILLLGCPIIWYQIQQACQSKAVL